MIKLIAPVSVSGSRKMQKEGSPSEDITRCTHHPYMHLHGSMSVEASNFMILSGSFQLQYLCPMCAPAGFHRGGFATQVAWRKVKKAGVSYYSSIFRWYYKAALVRDRSQPTDEVQNVACFSV